MIYVNTCYTFLLVILCQVSSRAEETSKYSWSRFCTFNLVIQQQVTITSFRNLRTSLDSDSDLSEVADQYYHCTTMAQNLQKSDLLLVTVLLYCDVTLSRQEGSTTRHLASAQYWDRPAGGNTGCLFLTFGGPVYADRISHCPLDRVLTYKNLIYLLNLQFVTIVTLDFHNPRHFRPGRV